ncbi:HEAT repeat domain-containing protein [bacterium]|nr:HEAT repeat domain-containing protein [bacterium]
MRQMILVSALCVLAVGCTPSVAADKAPRSTEQLLAAFGDALPGVRLAAAKELAGQGAAVAPKLLVALKDKDWRVRRSATDALAELKADAKPAVPALMGALTDENLWVRAGAADALGKIGEDATAAIPALVKAAGDQDVWVRRSAMEALARGGITKDKAVLLKAALNVMAAPDTGWAAKRFAMGVLQRDGKQYKDAIPVYVKILDNPPEGMWDGTPAVVELLTGMGAADKAVAPLIKMLDPTRRHIPRKAADALAKLGPVAKPAIPALKVLAEKAIDKGAKEAALKAIEKIEASK